MSGDGVVEVIGEVPTPNAVHDAGFDDPTVHDDHRVQLADPGSRVDVVPAGRVEDSSELVVRCLARLPQRTEPLAGIDVSLLWPNGQPACAVQPTGRDGTAAFAAIAAGDYLVYGKDPRGFWSRALSGAGTNGRVSVPTATVTLEFVPGYVACFRLIGDEVLAVRTGRHPACFGFDTERRPLFTSSDDVQRFYYRLLETTAPGNATVEVIAYGKMRGQCRFQVPLTRADLQPEPVPCDLSTFPLRPALQVNLEVMDSVRNPIALDPASFFATEGPAIVVRSTDACWLPSGYEYAAVLGRFPIRWHLPDNAKVDARTPASEPRTVVVQLPIELIEKRIFVTLAGSPVTQTDASHIEMRGVFGDRNGTRGMGGKTAVRSGDLGKHWLPLGTTRWVLNVRGQEHETEVEIVRGEADLVIDFER